MMVISLGDGDNTVVSVLTSDSIVAIAASRRSTIQFIKVCEAECVSKIAELDDYEHSIAKGVAYMKGFFIEKVTDSANGQIFKISMKVTSFYKESVL